MVDAFKPLNRGDLVRHKLLPNAPVMLVVSPVKDAPAGHANCHWFSPDGHYHAQLFPTEYLERVEPTLAPAD